MILLKVSGQSSLTRIRLALHASAPSAFILLIVLTLKSLQNPKWNPPSLDEVNQKEVEAVFEPLGPGIEELKV